MPDNPDQEQRRIAALRPQRDALRGSREVRSRPFTGCEMREAPNGTGNSDLTFTGYASVFDAPYPVTDSLGTFSETVTRSAFDKTIAEGCDTALLLNHEGLSLARTKSGTLRLSTDSTGLHVLARLDPGNYAVQALRSAVERGDIDEMSFGFRVVRDSWNKSYDDRKLLECSLHHGDVSPVNFGANAATAGLVSMRNRGRAAARFAKPTTADDFDLEAALTITRLKGRRPSTRSAVDLSTRAPLHGLHTGSHSHSHPANGSQGGWKSHTHVHSHQGDSTHAHSHVLDGTIDDSEESMATESNAAHSRYAEARIRRPRKGA